MRPFNRQEDIPVHHHHPRSTICMFGHDVSITHDLVKHVVKVAMEHGVNLLHVDGGLVNSLHGFESQANIMYDLIDKDMVDGLIIEGVIFHYAGPEEMRRLCERYAPLPMVTQEVPIPGIPRTYIDFYQGMYDIEIMLYFERTVLNDNSVNTVSLPCHGGSTDVELIRFTLLPCLPPIAHAGGAYRGLIYTNSVEALEENADSFHLFEIDLSWSEDNQLVGLHDWGNTFSKFFGFTVEEPIDYAAFLELKTEIAKVNVTR